MTSWAAQMAEYFGILAHARSNGACNEAGDEEAYDKARLAGHFGRIALGQTVNWPVVDSLELLEHAPRR